MGHVEQSVENDKSNQISKQDEVWKDRTAYDCYDEQ